jgi:hypothetical protein
MQGNERQMQRVRVGLTGLGFVFVAVLLATALTSRSADEPPITPNLIEMEKSGAAPAGTAPAEAPPADPLAELGVAPGNADSNAAARVVPAPAR